MYGLSLFKYQHLFFGSTLQAMTITFHRDSRKILRFYLRRMKAIICDHIKLF